MSLAAIYISVLLWKNHEVTWKVLTVSAVIPALAMIVAFLLAWLILKKNPKTAFLLISYRGEAFAEMFPPLVFCGLFGTFEIISVVLIYRLAKLEFWGRQKTGDESAQESLQAADVGSSLSVKQIQEAQGP